MKVINLSMASGHFFYSQSEIRQGENLASRLNIILSDDFLGYTYNLLFKLNDNPPVLTEPLTSDEDNSINYILKREVTFEAGILQVELQASDPATGLIAKSSICRLKVIESIDGSCEVMPEEYVPWVTVINTAVAAATEQAGLAEGYAQTASTKATEASEHAATASTKAGEASGFASTASTKATEASGYAATASTKATEASGYAATASTKATEASGYAATASTKAEEAAASAVTAVNATAGKADKSTTYTKTENDTAMALKADKATTYTKTEVDTKDATKADKLMATNLVTNGDFSQGTTGWTAVAAVNSVANNTLTSTGLGTSETCYARQSTLIPVTLNDVWYIKSRQRVLNTFCGSLVLQLTNNSMSQVLTVGVTRPIKDQWYDISERLKLTNANANGTSGGLLLFHIYGSPTDANGAQMEVQKVQAVNLTKIFGAGNEPSKETMDRLLAEFPNSWFDGTAELMTLKLALELLYEKANKTQEAWITPTLLNGATGTVKYMKDTLGFVHFKGTIDNPTGSSKESLTMPVGYRPAESSYFAVRNTSNSTSTVFITNLGLTYIGSTITSSNGSLDGITFKAEG